MSDADTTKSAQNTPARSQPKYKRVADVLAERIHSGALSVGDKLPTMQELAREFSVSVVTAFRAVQLLAGKGLVSTERRRAGTVVIRRSPPAAACATTIVCLLRPPQPRRITDTFALEIIKGIRREISARGYRFIYHGLDESDYGRRVADAVAGGSACAVLMDQNTPLSVVRALSQLGVPATLFNRRADIANLSTVLPDYESMARSTVRAFAEKSYRRLAFYLMPADESSWDEARAAEFSPLVAKRQAFIQAAMAQGYTMKDIRLIPQVADADRLTDPEAYDLPRARPPEWRPIAILADNDMLATNLIAAIAKTDLRLATDIGVVGCYDLASGRRSPTPPSTWKTDFHAVGVAAVTELLDRVESPTAPASVCRIPLEYLDRGTA